MKKLLLALCCCMMMLGLGGCNSYRLSKDYADKSTFGYLVFISKSGASYDDLWVNISGLDKTFLASTCTMVDGKPKGRYYAAQQGKRQVMVRQKNERMLYQGVVKILQGEITIIEFDD